MLELRRVVVHAAYGTPSHKMGRVCECNDRLPACLPSGTRRCRGRWVDGYHASTENCFSRHRLFSSIIIRFYSSFFASRSYTFLILRNSQARSRLACFRFCRKNKTYGSFRFGRKRWRSSRRTSASARNHRYYLRLIGVNWLCAKPLVQQTTLPAI